MNTFGIKALQTNPSLLTKSFEAGEYSLITKHGNPIGLAIGFDALVIDEGLKRFLALKAFAAGDLSLGELARSLVQDRETTMMTLDALGIPIADYDFSEDLKTLGALGL